MTSKTVTTCTFMVIETGKATATALQGQGMPSCKAGEFSQVSFSNAIHHFVLLWPFLLSFLLVEGNGRTHEKHASPQRTWKPEGKVWEQSWICPRSAVCMLYSGRTRVWFPIQAELPVYFMCHIFACFIVKLAMTMFLNV